MSRLETAKMTAELTAFVLGAPPEYLLIPVATNTLSLLYEAGRYVYGSIKKEE